MTGLQIWGRCQQPEKRVLSVFVLTALLWITRDLINKLGWFRLDDNMIAIFGALLLFIIPARTTENGQKNS